MSNLLASLSNSGNALGVLQDALAVIQNNVSNASTPGYAAQKLQIVAQPLDLTAGAAGGIASQGLISSRDTYADTEVRRQLQSLGYFTSRQQGTGQIQTLFDVTGNSGVTAALTGLFNAFSAWAASPGDPTVRQNVLTQATAVADSVRSLNGQLTATGNALDQQVGSTVGQINSLAEQVRQYNELVRGSHQPDPGADANLTNNLESLSRLTDLTTLRQQDGTVTLLTAGGTPLVIGADAYQLHSVTQSGAVQILDQQNHDITGNTTGGELGGLLETRNRTLNDIVGTGTTGGTLNQFTSGLADAVNGILTAGRVSTAAGAASGLPLFSYDSSGATSAAASIRINPSITADQLAAADAAGNVNASANQLAALADPTNVQGQIGGIGLTGFFAGIAASAGQENQSAQSNQTVQESVTAQAKSLRDHISGVSLDSQASALLEFQRAYQAVARVLTVINGLADSALGIIPHA